jgi:hypothetical protein
MFLLAAVAMIAAEPATEVSRPALPGFVVGYKATQGGASILEEVPAGETVQRWSRMVTTQRFDGIGFRVSPSRMVGRIATGFVTGCAGGTATDVQNDGDFSTMRADCPRNPQTGLPETVLARAIADGATLHVFQVAWRSVPTAAELAWAETYLKGIKLTTSN